MFNKDKSGEYGQNGSHAYWYDFTKNNILSEEYLVYIFKTLIYTNRLSFSSECNLLSIGMNKGLYEEKLLDFLRKEFPTCIFKFYFFDSEREFQEMEHDKDIIILDKFDINDFDNKKLDIILDLRSSLWYKKYNRKKHLLPWKSVTQKLIKAYYSILKENGILIIDKAETLNDNRIRTARKNLKYYLQDKNAEKTAEIKCNLLLENSTYEEILKLPIVKQGEIVDTDEIIQYIDNEEYTTSYKVNRIGICLLKQ